MPQTQTIATASPVSPTLPELTTRIVRCACEECGAHTNAEWSFRVAGSCPTCGSFRLVPVDDAEVMIGVEVAF